MQNTALFYQLSLVLLPKIGPKTAKNLVSYCGGTEAIFKETKKSLLKIPGVGPVQVNKILSKSTFGRAESEFNFIEKNNIKTFFYLDQDYPERLKRINDAPILLFQNGSAGLNNARNVAIVGTRKATPWGKLTTERIVNQLQEFDVNIISGLANGIDGTAHKKCLELEIPTIGVVAHGLDTIYPKNHRSIAAQMATTGGGAILTEFVSHTLPEKERFPMRNRIIAGLCDALIIIESARSGGSMISANFANNYSKDVFAIPGRINDINSAGCNFLIKTNKAHLLESGSDIGYIMGWDRNVNEGIQQELFSELSKKEKKILHILTLKDLESVDQLAFKSNSTASEISSLLLNMEFKGLIKSIPGKRYLKISKIHF